MPNLLIRDLPEEVHRRLKERAAQNRRSMSQEALLLLEEALGWRMNETLEPPAPFKGDFEIDYTWLDEAKRSGRA
jgi:plasmid stability protein